MLVEKFLIGNPDTVDIGRGRVGYFELVEVVVFPSHRVLDGNVEVPEAVVARDLDALRTGGFTSCKDTSQC